MNHEHVQRRRIRRRAAAVLAAAGLIDLASALTPPMRDRLGELLGWVPLVIPETATAGVALARRSRERRVLVVPVLSLLVLIPYASLIWYGDAFDVSRHAIIVKIVMRLSPLLLALFLIDARLDPSSASIQSDSVKVGQCTMSPGVDA